MSREAKGPGIAVLAGVAVLIGVLFVLLFSFRRLGPLDFWWWMVLNVLLTAGLSLAADGGFASRLKEDFKTGLARKTGLGLVSAVLLYGLFAAGRLAALKIFPFASAGIASIYGLKSGAGIPRLVLLVGLLIGPGEEIVWRGFLQENLTLRFGRGAGLALTVLAYMLVHIGSGNIMLILAAGVCGLFWGLTYGIFRSTVLNAVSHAAWALLVFVITPF